MLVVGYDDTILLALEGSILSVIPLGMYAHSVNACLLGASRIDMAGATLGSSPTRGIARVRTITTGGARRRCRWFHGVKFRVASRATGRGVN